MFFDNISASFINKRMLLFLGHEKGIITSQLIDSLSDASSKSVSYEK